MKELKALEILTKNKKLQSSVEPNYLKQAIKELEELNNRSCSKCNNNIFNKGKKEYGCNRLEINPRDMKQVGFYCSKYETEVE